MALLMALGGWKMTLEKEASLGWHTGPEKRRGEISGVMACSPSEVGTKRVKFQEMRLK